MFISGCSQGEMDKQEGPQVRLKICSGKYNKKNTEMTTDKNKKKIKEMFQPVQKPPFIEVD